MPQLDAWANFYVIVGSSAAGLTGLQFVVITLVSESTSPGSADSIAAFGSPNVAHFAAALLVSSVLSMPWHTLPPAGLVVVAIGLAGLVYSGVVIHRAHRQTVYKPVLEDWIWHTMLPPLAYFAMMAGGAFLAARSDVPLFMIAFAALLLILIGLHNAWDTVTYVITSRMRARAAKSREGG